MYRSEQIIPSHLVDVDISLTKPPEVRSERNREAANVSREKKRSADYELEADVELGRKKGRILKLRIQSILLKILEKAQRIPGAPATLDVYNMGSYLIEHQPQLYNTLFCIAEATMACPNLFPN